MVCAHSVQNVKCPCGHDMYHIWQACFTNMRGRLGHKSTAKLLNIALYLTFSLSLVLRAVGKVVPLCHKHALALLICRWPLSGGEGSAYTTSPSRAAATSAVATRLPSPLILSLFYIYLFLYFVSLSLSLLFLFRR